jgi:hypothetical protein
VQQLERVSKLVEIFADGVGIFVLVAEPILALTPLSIRKIANWVRNAPGEAEQLMETIKRFYESVRSSDDDGTLA